MDDHDGADAIERAWRDGLKPDPLLTVSEWADRYRILSQRASSEPGRWRTERTPYLMEIMDCLSPSSPVQRVALMKGAQIGGTECGNCWIGYIIGVVPETGLFLTAGVDVQKDRIEVEVVGWGRGKESWSVDYRVIERTPQRASTSRHRSLARQLLTPSRSGSGRAAPAP